MRVERSGNGGSALYFVTLYSRRPSRVETPTPGAYSFLEGSLTIFTLPEGVGIIRFSSGDFGHDGILDILLHLSNGAVMVLEGHEAGDEIGPSTTPTNQDPPSVHSSMPRSEEGPSSGASPPPASPSE